MTFSRRLQDLRSSKVFNISILCFTTFTDNLPTRALIPILPAALLNISHISKTDVANWASLITAVNAFTSLIFSPIFGYVSDHFLSRRATLLSALALWGVGLIAMMLCFSNASALVAVRLFQGACSAAIEVCVIALLIDTAGPGHTAVGVSCWQVTTNISAAVAPMLGGVMYYKLGFNSVFILPLIMLVPDVILLLVAREKRDVDYQEIKDAATCEEGDDEELSKSMTEHLEYAPLLFKEEPDVGVLRSQQRQPSIWDLLKSPRVLFAAFVCMIGIGIFSVFDTMLPIFLYIRWSWTTDRTGYLFLWCSIPKALSPVTGKLIDRYGVKWPTFVSLTLAAICLVALRVVQNDVVRDHALLIGLMCVVNIAWATACLAMMSEVGTVALEIETLTGKKGLVAQGGALITTSTNVGVMLGPILGGLIYQHIGWEALTLATGVLSAICLPGVLIFS